MNPFSRIWARASSALPSCLASLVLAWLFSPSPLLAQPAATGSVTGTVTNVVTGRQLAGASVDVAGAGRFTLTDADGRFMLRDLPSGSNELTISYVGLEMVRETVRVQPGGLHPLRIELTSPIYRAERLKGNWIFRGIGSGRGLAPRNECSLRSRATPESFIVYS